MGGIVFSGVCVLLICINQGIVQGAVCNYGGRCELKYNAGNARAKHPASTYRTSSCTPCLAQGREVHVVGVFQGFRNSLRLHLTRDSSTSLLPVTLLLLSFEAVAWNISTDADVLLQQIHVSSFQSEDSSVQFDQFPIPEITVYDQYLGYGSSRYNEILDFVNSNYGNLTSLTSVFTVNSNDTWTLTVGVTESCDHFQDNPGECYLEDDVHNARFGCPYSDIEEVYSCSTCISGGKEVHAVNIKQGIYGKEGLPDQVEYMELHVRPLPSGSAPVVLVLMSTGPVYWNITAYGGIYIEEILLGSYDSEKSDVLLDQSPMAVITRERSSYPSRSCPGSIIPVNFVVQRFGFITSYTGCNTVWSDKPTTLTTGLSASCPSRTSGKVTQPTDIGIYRTAYGKASNKSVIVRMNMFKLKIQNVY